MQPFNILLAEDNIGDARLTMLAFDEATEIKSQWIHHVKDGDEAVAYLLKNDEYATAPTPDLVLLDLNMPGKNGLEVLKTLRECPDTQGIPVIVLTTSGSEKDVREAYRLAANSFITKPADLDDFFEVVGNIENFWVKTARLPKNKIN